MLQSLRSKLFTADHAEQATGLDSAGLLEAIVCETHAAALQVAAIASGLNALQGKAPLKNPAELKNFLPSSSAVVGELLRSHEEAGVGDTALLRMKEFFRDLSAARAGIARLFADFDRLGVQQAVSHGNATTFTAWSSLCQRAVGAVSALDADLRDRLPPYYGENSAMLLRILKSASEGQCPCIDKSGNVVLPDMPQRRKAARRSLLQQCVLRHRGKTATVITKDISTTGLGLERTPELKKNDLVQVELTGGRRLIGAIVWASGTSAGVKLGKPLPPNDPLLGG
jgi:hypothetical protein